MALSAEAEARIVAELGKYPTRRSALLPALKLAQHDQHVLRPETLARVAELVGVSHAAANELATFYSMLATEQQGRKVVEVCVQLPCALQGADELLQRLAQDLGIAPGETTADGEVTLLRTHECFGSCQKAPMCLLNHEYRENLRGEAVERLLAELRAPALAESA
ncbi:MAG: NAD(P)H-dependent oxidoreductase subunit E [Chloroflexota bacterium]